MEPMLQEHDRFCVRIPKTGAPGAIPTRDLSLRRRALYAAELREHEAPLLTFDINNTDLRLVLNQ